MKVHTAIILDTRRYLDVYQMGNKKSNEKKYPLKLRLTYKRERKYYGIDIHLTNDEWKSVNGERPRDQFKEIRFQIDKLQKEADELIKNMEFFSFSSFERKFFNESLPASVKEMFRAYIKKLEEEKRIGTASSYDCAMKSFIKFNEDLLISEVTEKMLEKYEKWMIAQGNSKTTIGIYLRSLRTLVNLAMNEGSIKPQQYPFGKNKYQIPTGKNIKKAVNIDAIQQIVNYNTSSTAVERARDLWLFSYLCNGANIADICKFRYKNIQGDKLVFYRAKTERTSRSLKPIVVILSEKSKEIIDKWGTKPTEPGNFIFPVLSPVMSPKRQKDMVKLLTKVINKHMKKIGEDLGLGSDLTTYVARHTYSTILKRSGVPLSYISDSLGHHTIQTTENYLDSFEDEQKKEFADFLLPKTK